MLKRVVVLGSVFLFGANFLGVAYTMAASNPSATTDSELSWWSLRAGKAYLLHSEEVRTVGMIRLVYPPRDISKDIPVPWDKPKKTHPCRWIFIDQLFGRFDFNIGATMDKGEEDTSTQDEIFYLAGGSFELHKYFDFVGGYAISNEGSGQWYAGASMDLRMLGDFLKLFSGTLDTLAGGGSTGQ